MAQLALRSAKVVGEKEVKFCSSTEGEAKIYSPAYAFPTGLVVV